MALDDLVNKISLVASRGESARKELKRVEGILVDAGCDFSVEFHSVKSEGGFGQVHGIWCFHLDGIPVSELTSVRCMEFFEKFFMGTLTKLEEKADHFLRSPAEILRGD